jgi:Cytochrome C oxidase, cbb3-type, subunit III
MKAKNRFWRRVFTASGLCILLGAGIALIATPPRAFAGWHLPWCRDGHACAAPFAGCGEEPPCDEVGGAWYWLRSPEQEKRVVMSLFNRYCIRCHGIDGRGVWDIPDVPNFTNARWQESRSDGQLARAILEGRGAVMPPWRGTLSLEEAWAMARYLRTFVPGTEASRADFTAPDKAAPASPPVTSPKPQAGP